MTSDQLQKRKCFLELAQITTKQECIKQKNKSKAKLETSAKVSWGHILPRSENFISIITEEMRF